MSDQWKPRTADFREVWAAFNGYGGLVARPHSASWDEGYAEFDDWLDRERAEARGDRDAARENAEHYKDMLDAEERQRNYWQTRTAWAENQLSANAGQLPAVTREDVEAAVHGVYAEHGNWAIADELTDAVWSLVSDSDPAVFVVRESDVAAVEVTEHAAGWSAESKMLVSGWGKGKHLSVDMDVDRYRAELLNALAVRRAIEAEQADPLLDKAQEFAALADWELTDREAELLHTVAAHVLEQEDKR